MDARAIAAFVLVTLIWGSTWLVIKDQISQVPPSWSVAWRFAVATLGMFALALVRGESLRITGAAARLAVLAGVLQFSLNFQLVYRAEHYLTSGLVAVLFALLMLPNAVLARVFLGQRMSRGFIAGTGVAIAGIVCMLVHEYRAAPIGPGVPMGVALTLVAIICASCANVLFAGPTGRSVPIVPLTGWAMLCGALCSAAWAWIADGPPIIDPRPAYVLGVLYLALVGSVLAFPLYFTLIQQIGPARAAYNGVAVPVVAMALSTLFEGYRWSGLSIAGAAIAMAGLVLALRSR